MLSFLIYQLRQPTIKYYENINLINWHRFFGYWLIDLFINTPYEVELEKDLSLKQQFLDVVIIRKTDDALIELLPDGLDDLGEHSLITY